MVTVVRNIGSRTMDVPLDSRGHPAVQGLSFLNTWMGVLVINVLNYPTLAVPGFTEMAQAGLFRCLVNGLYKSCEYSGYWLNNGDDPERDPWNAAVEIVPWLVRFCIHPSVVSSVYDDMQTIPPKAFNAASEKLAGYLKAKIGFVPRLEEVRERVLVWHAGLETHRSSKAMFNNDTCLCDNPSVCIRTVCQ